MRQSRKLPARPGAAHIKSTGSIADRRSARQYDFIWRGRSPSKPLPRAGLRRALSLRIPLLGPLSRPKMGSGGPVALDMSDSVMGLFFTARGRRTTVSPSVLCGRRALRAKGARPFRAFSLKSGAPPAKVKSSESSAYLAARKASNCALASSTIFWIPASSSFWRNSGSTVAGSAAPMFKVSA